MWGLFRSRLRGAARSETRVGDLAGAAPAVRDRRIQPAGVMPQHGQAWLLIGLSVAMVAIIAFSGRSSGRPLRAPAVPAATEPNIARIEAYQRRLDEAARQLRTQQDALEHVAREPDAHRRLSGGSGQGDEPAASTSAARERDRSLSADNVAFTRKREERMVDGARAGAGISGDRVGLARAAVASASESASASEHGSGQDQALVSRSARATTASSAATAASAGGPGEVIPAGTLIEAVLLNRLDGTFAGPVMASVSVSVYAEGSGRVLIPAGARVLGEAAPVSVFGQSRLAVTFHRLQLPDRRAINLDQFVGLSALGDAGLQDQVDRHYMRLFGVSAAIGLLSGFTQYGTRSGLDESFSDLYRQAAGVNIAQSGMRLVERFSNILPTVTIREGHRLLIYISTDLAVPSAAPAPSALPALP